jgi:DNA-binding CsgD family transcriptional regulator
VQIERVINALREAADADGVGTAAAALGRELFGLRECGVTWQTPALGPSGSALAPGGWWLHERGLLAQLLDALRARHEPVVHGDKLLLPVIEPAGLLGAICCAHDSAYTDSLLRGLTTLAAHVSVRLAQLGTRTANANVLGRLTPRQSDVALLAARGRPNSAIATALGLSENTVKKHLKDIFDELEVSNRTELAIRLGEAAPAHVPLLRVAGAR